MRNIRLSAVECRVILSALLSALAGCPSEGDYCWSAAEELAAQTAVEKLTPDTPQKGAVNS